jgi:hypothetical protein
MMLSRRHLFAILPIASLLAPSAYSQFPGFGGKKKKEKPTRTVKGEITDNAEEGLRAVVQLKNTKTLAVKSFHTNDKGEFYFHGLDLNVDYEIKAIAAGKESKTRTISTFDERTELIYNFQLKSVS